MSSTAGEKDEMNSRFNYNCFPSSAAVICVPTDSLINAMILDTVGRSLMRKSCFFRLGILYSIHHPLELDGMERLKFYLFHSNLDYSRNIHN